MADQGPVALPEGRGASHPPGAAQDARELKRAARADRQRAREVQSGSTRAAVLGVSDGLVTNVSLILGVAGATQGGDVVLIAGLASLVAGAASMAVGEYVSMTAQVELLQRLLADYRKHLGLAPEEAREEIEDFIRRGGVQQATAHNASQQIAMVPDRALAVYARSLGLDPEELGSPWKAALTSLFTFAAGALVPLLPWFFRSGIDAAVASIALGERRRSRWAECSATWADATWSGARCGSWWRSRWRPPRPGERAGSSTSR